MPTKTIQILGPFKRYSSISECIYCGAIGIELTHEHVLPRGIAGNALIFEKASCKTCAHKFNLEFENTILKQTMYPFRFKIGAPSKKKATWPTAINVLHHRLSGEPSRVQVRAYTQDALPLGLIAPRLRSPKIFTGEAATFLDTVDAWSNINSQELSQLYLSEAPVRVYVGQIDVSKFCRFLAKIAYAYIVGELGKNSFTPLLMPFINGQSQTFTDLVGGDYEIEAATENLHEIAPYVWHSDVDKYICVRLRLFACYGAPTYHLIVGLLHNDIAPTSR